MNQTGSPFEAFFGSANPAQVIVAIVVLGAVSMAWLRTRRDFSLHETDGGLRGVGLAAGVGTALATVTILVDLAGAFPVDINVPLPQALYFYPAMALVVEALFHLVPLAVLLALLGLGPLPRERAVVVALLLVALLEPAFQLVLADYRGDAGWVQIFLLVHLTVFNVIQLALFRRHGLLSMVTLRLAYYLIWHLVWGVLRLPLLF